MFTEKEIQKHRKDIIRLLKSTKRKGIENLVSWFEDSDFFIAPASTMFHGNYPGGLAAHSHIIYKEFKERVKHYDLKVPEESVIIPSICHDCCKINYYVPNVLASGNISKSKPYKVEDNFPIGHGEKSVVLAEKHINLTPQEAVIIRWHMGNSDPAWETYQNKIEANYPEAIVFHNVDMEVSKVYNI